MHRRWVAGGRVQLVAVGSHVHHQALPVLSEQRQKAIQFPKRGCYLQANKEEFAWEVKIRCPCE